MPETGIRYSMRRSTRQQSEDSLQRSASRRTSSSQAGDMPAPSRRLQGGARETMTGISARGTPATSRSTAYGGRDLQPPTGLTTQGAQTSRSRPTDTFAQAVESSRDATNAASRRSGSSGRRSPSNASAFTDESPLGADETIEEPADADESVEDNAQPAPARQSPKGRRKSTRRTSPPQQQQAQQQPQQPLRREAQPQHQSQPQRPMPQQREQRGWEVVAMARRGFAAARPVLDFLVWFFSVTCMVIFALLLVHKSQQVYMPSLSSSAPAAYLHGLADRVLDALHAPPSVPINWNSTPQGAPVHAGVSSWQFDRLSNRVSKLETSLGSLSTTDKGKATARRVNFFAPASGVFIDPYLTSPTRPLYISPEAARAVPKTFGDILRRVLKMRTPPVLLPRTGPGPSSVFQAWDEAGECWCSPPGGSKAQIAMILPRPVIPQDLVVEHIPESATLDTDAMPRDLEFWVQIEDPLQRQKVGNTVMDVVDTELPYGDDGPMGARASPSAAEEPFGTKRALDETWIRIGRFQYSKDSGEPSQTFHIPVDLAEHNVPVSKVVVRATSSWGDEDSSVCLYRLKLHGLAASDAGLGMQS